MMTLRSRQGSRAILGLAIVLLGAAYCSGCNSAAVSSTATPADQATLAPVVRAAAEKRAADLGAMYQQQHLSGSPVQQH